MKRKFTMTCPTCGRVCEVRDTWPYPHYECAVHGVMYVKTIAEIERLERAAEKPAREVKP